MKRHIVCRHRIEYETPRNNKPAATVRQKRPGQSCQCLDGQTVCPSLGQTVLGLLRWDCVCRWTDLLLSPAERERCERKGSDGDRICHCFMWRVTFRLVLWLLGLMDFVVTSPFTRGHSEASHCGGDAQMAFSAISGGFCRCASVEERLGFARRREHESGALVWAVILVWEALVNVVFFCFPFVSKFPSLVD